MKVELHSFTMSDVEDPEIYAAQPIFDWQQTDFGKWCMKHGSDLAYHISADYASFGYRVTITGEFSKEYETFIILKNS